MLDEPQHLRQARQAERERGRAVDLVLDEVLSAFDRAFARAERRGGYEPVDPIDVLAPKLPWELKRDAKRRERREMRAATTYATPIRGWVAHGSGEYSHPVVPMLRVKRVRQDNWAWMREDSVLGWCGKFVTRGEAFEAGRRHLEAADAR